MRRASFVIMSLATVVAVSCASPTDPTSEASSRDTPMEAADPVAAAETPPSGDVTMTAVTVGDLTFDVRMAGPTDGEVVILLHGFSQTSYERRSQIIALGEAGYRAVAPNQRGYSAGARPTQVEDYAVPRLVEDIVGLADAIGADRFHIV